MLFAFRHLSAASGWTTMRTRADGAAAALGSLPDDAFQQVIEAFADIPGSVPFFYAVQSLGCVSKGMRQQLYRLQPLVGVRHLSVVQRPAHGPWRVVLFYTGRLTAAVFEQARLGRVPMS